MSLPSNGQPVRLNGGLVAIGLCKQRQSDENCKRADRGDGFHGSLLKNGGFENESQSAARGNAGGSVDAILAVATMGVKRAASDPSLRAPYIACLDG